MIGTHQRGRDRRSRRTSSPSGLSTGTPRGRPTVVAWRSRARVTGTRRSTSLDTGHGRPDPADVQRGQDHDPTWSPDGTQIAFASDRDGNQEIYVVGGLRGSRAPPHRRSGTRAPARVVVARRDRVRKRPDGRLRPLRHGRPGRWRGAARRGIPGPTSIPPGRRTVPRSRTRTQHTASPRHLCDRCGRAEPAAGHRIAGGPEHFPAWSPDGTRIAFAVGQHVDRGRARAGRRGRHGRRRERIRTGARCRRRSEDPISARTFTITPVGARVLVAPATSQPPTTAPGLEARAALGGRAAVSERRSTRSQGSVAVDAVTTTPEGPGQRRARDRQRRRVHRDAGSRRPARNRRSSSSRARVPAGRRADRPRFHPIPRTGSASAPAAASAR